jgi:hypothetical protein
MFIPNSILLRLLTFGTSIFGFLIGTLLLHDGVKGILPLILLQVGRGFFNALTGFKDMPIGKNKKLIGFLLLLFFCIVLFLSKSVLLSCLFLVGMSNRLLLNRSIFISVGSPAPLGILFSANALTYLGLYILDDSFDYVIVFALGISASIALFLYIWFQNSKDVLKAFTTTEGLQIEPLVSAVIFGLTNALLIIFFDRVDELYYLERGLLFLNNVYVVPYLYRRHASYEVVVIRLSLVLFAISLGFLSIWIEELSIVGAILLFPYLSKLFRVYQVENNIDKFSYLAILPLLAFTSLLLGVPFLGYFIFWILTLYFLARRCVGHYRIGY